MVTERNNKCVFTKKSMTVFDNSNQPVIHGYNTGSNMLFRLDLQTHTSEQCSANLVSEIRRAPMPETEAEAKEQSRQIVAAHRRLGHIGYTEVRRLLGLHRKVIADPCDACHMFYV